MVTINPYLNFGGNTEEAFNFYKSVFGGEFTVVQRFKDLPEGQTVPVEDQEKLMHISLPIGKNNILMATDVVASLGQKLVKGTNFSISISVESEAEAEKIFNGLSAGGNVVMPLEKSFWGAYFGYFFDKFGVQWMVNYDYNK